MDDVRRGWLVNSASKHTPDREDAAVAVPDRAARGRYRARERYVDPRDARSRLLNSTVDEVRSYEREIRGARRLGDVAKVEGLEGELTKVRRRLAGLEAEQRAATKRSG